MHTNASQQKQMRHGIWGGKGTRSVKPVQLPLTRSQSSCCQSQSWNGLPFTLWSPEEPQMTGDPGNCKKMKSCDDRRFLLSPGSVATTRMKKQSRRRGGKRQTSLSSWQSFVCFNQIWNFVKQMITSRYWEKENVRSLLPLSFCRFAPMNPVFMTWHVTADSFLLCLSNRHRHTAISSVSDCLCGWTAVRRWKEGRGGYWMTGSKLLSVIDKDRRGCGSGSNLIEREGIKICPWSAQKQKNTKIMNHAAL